MNLDKQKDTTKGLHYDHLWSRTQEDLTLVILSTNGIFQDWQEKNWYSFSILDTYDGLVTPCSDKNTGYQWFR